MFKKTKQEARIRRHQRVRANIRGTVGRPRLSVFRSNRHIWAQLVDDTEGHTLVSVSDREIKGETERKELAIKVGELVAQKAREKKITAAVFDRGGYKFHGKVKAVAEGARKGGLKI